MCARTEGLEQAAAVLPDALQQVLFRVPPEVAAKVQEIRLRKNTPLTLSLSDGEWVTADYICKGNNLVTVFEHLCGYSVHTHQQELRQGYIRTENGCRAGIAGTAVVENGQILSMRDVTAICLRVSREHIGCAKSLAFTLSSGGRLHSALLCGEPASGKTSLLRDLVREWTVVRHPPFHLTVVDERGELNLGESAQCEVLIGCPKAAGIEQALRTLAPEGIVFDELGDAAEVTAVLSCLNSGVAAVASLHADGIESLKRRPAARQAIQSGAFEQIVLLAGRRAPGVVERILPATELSL